MEKLHQEWDTIMNLPFYDLQNVLESYTRILKERKEEEEKEMKSQGYNPEDYRPENMQRVLQSNMPKMQMPKMPNIPKF